MPSKQALGLADGHLCLFAIRLRLAPKSAPQTTYLTLVFDCSMNVCRARCIVADHSDAVKCFAMKRALNSHKQPVVTRNKYGPQNAVAIFIETVRNTGRHFQPAVIAP